jgi:Fe-S cluster assembly iron-binding protein IscA
MEMVSINSEVIRQIKDMLQESKVKTTTLRIVANEDEHGSYGLQLDRVLESDKVEDHEGIQFIISQELYLAFGGFSIVSVDIEGEIYLQIRPYRETSKCGSGCSSCSSCG